MARATATRTRRGAVSEHGEIYRDGNLVIVRTRDGNDGPNTECENPRALKNERVYRTIFRKKPIFLPDEYDKAVIEILSGHEVLIIGMNGYSRLTVEQCAAWGVKSGAYEAACKALLHTLTLGLNETFPGIDVRYVHGASDLGIDKSVISVGHNLNRSMLGFSCPRFMPYVMDDNDPVYVAATQPEYADTFVKSLDILIAANGRLQAFKHDISAAFLYLKHVIPINVLKSISTSGGPPATLPNGQIEDAVAAFEQHVHLIGQNFGFTKADKWNELVSHVQDVVTSLTRNIVSPERAFSVSNH